LAAKGTELDKVKSQKNFLLFVLIQKVTKKSKAKQ
jgi:hypothetical protein